MDKLQTVKTIAKFIVGIGTTTIVNQIVTNNVRPRGAIDGLFIKSGSLVAGFMMADATTAYVDKQIDEIAAVWNKDIKKN